MSLAQAYMFIMVKKKSKMYYLLLSNGSKYLATRLRAVISVVYGYIRQIMLIIHESDDCTITVMTMMTRTMFFLMRNMERSSNLVLRTISTWMKSKLHEGWYLICSPTKLNKDVALSLASLKNKCLEKTSI